MPPSFSNKVYLSNSILFYFDLILFYLILFDFILLLYAILL